MIVGGMLAYALLQWLHADELKVFRFAGVIVGAALGWGLGLRLSELLWKLLLLTFAFAAAIVIGTLLWRMM